MVPDKGSKATICTSPRVTAMMLKLRDEKTAATACIRPIVGAWGLGLCCTAGSVPGDDDERPPGTGQAHGTSGSGS